MFGQGIGPIESERLRKKAKRALQHVRLIGLREKQASLPLLAKLGVDESRIRVTGDDAIELAHRQRPSCLGAEIGVNLRVAYYSEVSEARINDVGEVLRRVAAAREASLIPIPIAYDGQGSDVDTITKIFEAAGEKTDGGASCKSPEDVAQAAGRCRVVVTGSYHAGVFALSQGVPVVALSKSAYYNNKFNGLADMFGTGCTVLRTGDSSFSERLSEAVHKAYVNASDVRPSLLSAAHRQIKASRQAYRTMINFLVDKTRN
jgi:colanic acid/amylovoran biosynthesis protein